MRKNSGLTVNMFHMRDLINTVSRLDEARSAPLYHWMDGGKIRNVMSSDMLEGRVVHPIPGMGDVKGVSLSRNKLFTFGERGQVRLTLDQAQLAARFKMIPLDGEAAFRRHNELEPTVTDRGNTDREEWKFAEEFLVGSIPELHRYVIQIFIKQGTFRLPVQEYLACAAYAEKWAIPLITDPKTMADDVELSQRRLASWKRQNPEFARKRP